MTIVGTSYFVSFNHACRYYAPYEQLHWYNPVMRAIVQRKIDEGLIHIGKPELKPGQTLSLLDNGTRYAITD